MSKIHIVALAAGMLFPSMAFAEAPAGPADPVPVDAAPAAPAAMAKPADQAKVDRMADLLVQAVPFGRIFEMASRTDPHWPVQDNPDAVDATQLACLRGELSPDGFRRNKRSEVEAYVAAHPKQVGDEIALLEAGAASLMNKSMLAGAESGITGKDTDANQILSEATPEQFLSFLRFINAPEYADLRKLAGIGDAIDLTESAKDNENSGERLGMDMAMKAILQAMGTCKVPMSAVLK